VLRNMLGRGCGAGPGWAPAGGIAVYHAMPVRWPAAGATVPSLAAAVAVYLAADRTARPAS